MSPPNLVYPKLEDFPNWPRPFNGTHKGLNGYRDFSETAPAHTQQFYKQNVPKMTLEHVLKLKKKYMKFERVQCTFPQLLDWASSVVDESDPDIDESQWQHAFQTADRAIELYPGEENRWLHFGALIHDLGKVLALKVNASDYEPLKHWESVGDTFPVGVAMKPECVFSHLWPLENPDATEKWSENPEGIYFYGCGFDKMHFSFSHDEYLAAILERNAHLFKNGGTIDERIVYIVRYHSFYPWHDYGAYREFASAKDLRMIRCLKMFQRCDLYSKSNTALIEGEQTASAEKSEIVKRRKIDAGRTDQLEDGSSAQPSHHDSNGNSDDVHKRASSFLMKYKDGYYAKLIDDFVGLDTVIQI